MNFEGKCSIKLVTYESGAVTKCANNKGRKSKYSQTSIEQPPIKQPTFM